MKDEIASADLVISHCGAGSILEILHARKKAIGVINSRLLDNHQVELAEKMEESNYMAIARSPEDLLNVILKFEWDRLQNYPKPDESLFLTEVSRLIRFP